MFSNTYLKVLCVHVRTSFLQQWSSLGTHLACWSVERFYFFSRYEASGLGGHCRVDTTEGGDFWLGLVNSELTCVHWGLLCCILCWHNTAVVGISKNCLFCSHTLFPFHTFPVQNSNFFHTVSHLLKLSHFWCLQSFMAQRNLWKCAISDKDERWQNLVISLCLYYSTHRASQ